MAPRRRASDSEPWQVRHRALIVVLIVLAASVVGLFALTYRIDKIGRQNDRDLYHATVASCQRQNAARDAANDSARSLRAFLLAAAATQRQRAAHQDAADARLSHRAAETFEGLARHQHIIPIVNCVRAIPKP
jgi:uncharacterized membrane protein YdfJ with MMPL/SSD domain